MKIIPELRFPDFTNDGQWKADTVQNIVTTKSPPKKLQSSEYLDEGVFPIIDQSQSFYCGYTNDQQAIINEDLPLVIFGDHTCALKMAREPFAQGADGIKILKSKAFIDPEYLYQYLTYNGVKQENYRRHYSKLKEKIVPYPEFKSGEQQKIASCLSSLDELIAAHNDKLDALKDHKKGLLQNLFPQEGETVPKVRFPEFEDDGEWDSDSLVNIAQFRRGSFPQPYGLPEWYDDEDGMPFIQVYDVDDNFRLKSSTKRKISELAAKQSVFIEKGTVIITIQGSIGRVAITQYDAYIDRTLLIFQEFYDEIDKTFFAYTLFLLFEIEKQKAPGGIIKTITKQVLSDFTIKMPSLEEQKKIASCLSAVDELITAQQEKIEELKQHKKGMMQGLFPKVER